MMRLWNLQDIHRHIATDLMEKGDLRAAEEHHILGGDWKGAVDMYRNAEMWNDAYRIAREKGSGTTQKQVSSR